MGTLVATPNPAPINSTVNIDGSGYAPKIRVRIQLNGGTVTNLRSRSDGTFKIGVAVGTVNPANIQSQIIKGSTWTNDGAISVPLIVSPPPPPPPTITITSGPTVSNVTQTSGTVTWTLSEPATGQVFYGTTSSYGSSTTKENSFTYSTHVQTITGLVAGTTYHFQVVSANAAGATVKSVDQTFTTVSAQPPPPPPPPSTGDYMGVKIGADTLANTVIDG